MRGYVIGTLLVAVAIAIFVFQNNTQVAIQFLTWTSPKISLALVALIAACGGALITFFLDGMRYIKTAKKFREVTAENKKLNRELNQYRREQEARKANKNGNSTEEAATLPSDSKNA